MLEKTLEIINHFQTLNPNLVWYVENPRGKMRKYPKWDDRDWETPFRALSVLGVKTSPFTQCLPILATLNDSQGGLAQIIFGIKGTLFTSNSIMSTT